MRARDIPTIPLYREDYPLSIQGAYSVRYITPRDDMGCYCIEPSETLVPVKEVLEIIQDHIHYAEATGENNTSHLLEVFHAMVR
jgi:hypothetical protein